MLWPIFEEPGAKSMPLEVISVQAMTIMSLELMRLPTNLGSDLRSRNT
jgi:hypothetical protein